MADDQDFTIIQNGQKRRVRGRLSEIFRQLQAYEGFINGHRSGKLFISWRDSSLVIEHTETRHIKVMSSE